MLAILIYMRSGIPFDKGALLPHVRSPLGQAKQQRLASLTRAKLPLKELKPVPVPKFQTELIALKQAQFNLDQIVSQVNNFDATRSVQPSSGGLSRMALHFTIKTPGTFKYSSPRKYSS